MSRKTAAVLFSLLSLALVAGCIAPQAATPGAVGERSGAPARASTPKRIVAATPGSPLAFNERVARAVVSGPYRGGPELEWLMNSALTIVDDKGPGSGSSPRPRRP